MADELDIPAPSEAAPPAVAPTPHPRVWLDLSDDQLLAQCEIDLYRASGPGGQKRNKTSSAVRLRHKPTGLIVTASESRSQHENKVRAVRRLRQAIALTQRSSVPPGTPHPTSYAAAIGRDPSLHVSPRQRDYFHIVQYVLDVLETCELRVSDAAARLEVSTGQLIRFLKEDPKLWETVNQMRARHAHGPLK